MCSMSVYVFYYHLVCAPQNRAGYLMSLNESGRGCCLLHTIGLTSKGPSLCEADSIEPSCSQLYCSSTMVRHSPLSQLVMLFSSFNVLVPLLSAKGLFVSCRSVYLPLGKVISSLPQVTETASLFYFPVIIMQPCIPYTLDCICFCVTAVGRDSRHSMPACRYPLS